MNAAATDRAVRVEMLRDELSRDGSYDRLAKAISMSMTLRLTISAQTASHAEWPLASVMHAPRNLMMAREQYLPQVLPQ